MKKLLLSICVIAITYSTKAQIPGPLASQLQNVLNDAVINKGNNGVSAHLILPGGQTWSGTAGVNGQSQPITDSTVFHGASTTKLNIAILLLLLQEDTLLDLDDSWHKYVTTLNVAFDTNITIRQLLNHTSGIADYLETPATLGNVTGNFNYFYTPQYILENIVSGVPDFPAGTNFYYSSSNYVLAALVAEAVTGNPVQTELRTRLWNPLGMNHTYFGAYESYTESTAGVWWNFGSGLTNYSSQPTTSMLSYGYGGANIVTCPTDLAKLSHALSVNQLLNTQSMNELNTFITQSFSPWWTDGYGLGIHHLYDQKVDTVLGHNGSYTNKSDVYYSNMCGFTLAAMSNTGVNTPGIYRSLYDVLRNYYMCNNVPVANFYATPKTACAGATITFKDSSTNWSPTAWNWSFPGGTLTGGTTVTDSMPQVIYNTPGTYAVSYTASSSGGDDTITKNGYIAVNSGVPSYTTAFTEGFETATLPNADWSLDKATGLDWAVTSLGAGSGVKSVYIDNFSNQAGNNSTLMSTVFDISGFSQPKFSFKLAYQQKTSGNNDKLQVLTSTNCGSTWVVRLTRSGATLATVTPPSATPLAPTSAQFTTYTVNINGVAGSTNLRFMFKFFADTAGPGNNIFLDDINLYDGAVGIESNEAQIGLDIYPNPATEKVNIRSAQIMDEVTVQDVLGRVVYFARPKEKTVSVKIGKEGLYFVTVISGQQTTIRKLIVKD